MSGVISSAGTQGTDLLTNIGGEAAVARLVDALYERLVQDPLVRHHLHPDRLESLKAGQRAWFAAALSGADQLPVDLADMHAKLHIDDDQVAAVLGHLDAILAEMSVAPRVRRAVVSLVSRLWYARRF